jgi:hypothetical protein
MTANEMALQVKIQYEKLDSAGAPGIQDPVMSRILSNAQLYFVMSRLNEKTNNLGEGLEETELRGEGMSQLLATQNVLPSSPTIENVPNGTFFDLPKDYWFNMYEYALIDKINCITGKPIQPTIRAIRHDQLSRTEDAYTGNYYKVPFYNSYSAEINRLFYSRVQSGYDSSFVNQLNPTTNPTYNPTIDNGYDYLTTQTAKRHELVTDGTFNVTNYFVRYYKIPREIVVDQQNLANQRHCELDDFTHQTIIEIAVGMLKDALVQPNQDTINQQNVS